MHHGQVLYDNNDLTREVVEAAVEVFVENLGIHFLQGSIDLLYL
jgi:hypothetical protein